MGHADEHNMSWTSPTVEDKDATIAKLKAEANKPQISRCVECGNTFYNIPAAKVMQEYVHRAVDAEKERDAAFSVLKELYAKCCMTVGSGHITDMKVWLENRCEALGIDAALEEGR